MSDQHTFAGLAWAGKKKQTRRELFLADMDRVVPWRAMLALIAPHDPAPGRGRPPIPLERMLRIYFVQQWFALSDPAAEDAPYDSESIRRFVGIELGEETVPDETTLLRFRHLLEQHQLTEQLFALVRGLLAQQGVLVKSGTIVDATIVSAPSSTKNATGTRDPEMKQVRKGKEWYHGMRVHVGTDRRGVVHSLTTTDAAASEINQLPYLLHGEERALDGDRAYWSEADRQACEAAAIKYRMNRRGTPQPPISERWRQINRARSSVRARGEFAFHVVKCQWKYTKVRYRGLGKNTAQIFTRFALANLYLVRHRWRAA